MPLPSFTCAREHAQTAQEANRTNAIRVGRAIVVRVAASIDVAEVRRRIDYKGHPKFMDLRFLRTIF